MERESGERRWKSKKIKWEKVKVVILRLIYTNNGITRGIISQGKFNFHTMLSRKEIWDTCYFEF